MVTVDALAAASELICLLDVGMVRPFAMVRVRAESLREHQASMLRSELADVVDQSAGRVLLRFAGSGELCASCLRELLAESARCEALGGRLVVVGLSKPMRRMLRHANLDKLLWAEDSIAHAMRHFDARSSLRGQIPPRGAKAA